MRLNGDMQEKQQLELESKSKLDSMFKLEHLETESSGSPTIYFQKSQTKLCCNITKLSRTLVLDILVLLSKK